MRRLYAACLVFALGLPAQAQDAPIRATIEQQLGAMAAGDYARAFSYAAPNIKGIFKAPDLFEDMVRKGYPMVANHRSFKMLELRDVAGNLWQRVMITDSSGGVHFLDYMMVLNEGAWQIGAVQLLPDQGASA